jgi:HSP20 family molecular chaperone IbpA
MQLVRREPWWMAELERDTDRLVGRAFGPWLVPRRYRVLPLAEQDRWAPACDVFARDGDMVIRMDLPGIAPDKDVQVTVQDGILCISGERKSEAVQDGGRYYRQESSYGAFERGIRVLTVCRPRTSRRATTTGCSRWWCRRPRRHRSRSGSRSAPTAARSWPQVASDSGADSAGRPGLQARPPGISVERWSPDFVPAECGYSRRRCSRRPPRVWIDEETAMMPADRAAGRVASRTVLRTSCGRDLVVGRLRLDGLPHPTLRVTLDVGCQPYDHGEVWGEPDRR